ncbi:MAG TPA: SAM-dependent methyltransferase, partial [Actinomycetota bacterium]|nr:SAM-dependent methyltransferase [Actinomycetota bacterium]
DDQRRAYVDALTGATEAGSRYFLLCFSDRMPGTWGPRRMTQDEIRTSFARDWDVDSIDVAVFVTAIHPAVPAWLARMTRR